MALEPKQLEIWVDPQLAEEIEERGGSWPTTVYRGRGKIGKTPVRITIRESPTQVEVFTPRMEDLNDLMKRLSISTPQVKEVKDILEHDKENVTIRRSILKKPKSLETGEREWEQLSPYDRMMMIKKLREEHEPIVLNLEDEEIILGHIERKVDTDTDKDIPAPITAPDKPVDIYIDDPDYGYDPESARYVPKKMKRKLPEEKPEIEMTRRHILKKREGGILFNVRSELYDTSRDLGIRETHDDLIEDLYEFKDQGLRDEFENFRNEFPRAQGALEYLYRFIDPKTQEWSYLIVTRYANNKSNLCSIDTFVRNIPTEVRYKHEDWRGHSWRIDLVKKVNMDLYIETLQGSKNMRMAFTMMFENNTSNVLLVPRRLLISAREQVTQIRALLHDPFRRQNKEKALKNLADHFQLSLPEKLRYAPGHDETPPVVEFNPKHYARISNDGLLIYEFWLPYVRPFDPKRDVDKYGKALDLIEVRIPGLDEFWIIDPGFWISCPVALHATQLTMSIEDIKLQDFEVKIEENEQGEKNILLNYGPIPAWTIFKDPGESPVEEAVGDYNKLRRWERNWPPHFLSPPVRGGKKKNGE